MWRRWSLVAWLVLGCSIDREGAAVLDGGGSEIDAGASDAGTIDAGTIDAGAIDAGPLPLDSSVDAPPPPPVDSGVDTCVPETVYADADADGFGDPLVSRSTCSLEAGWVLDASDCNDACPTCHPGAMEVCDGADNDCNLIADDGVGTSFYADADADGFGDRDSTIRACTAPAGYTADATDCDDGCARCRPGFPEEICGDMRDNDCDGTVDETSCPCVSLAISSGTYAYCPAHTVWATGRAHCGSLGGYLASFESAAENAAVWAAVDARNDFIWIGGSDLGVEGTWEWESGARIGTCAAGVCTTCATSCNWESGQPNGATTDNCAFMHPDWMGRWGDWPCDTTFVGGFAVLCELP